MLELSQIFLIPIRMYFFILCTVEIYVDALLFLLECIVINVIYSKYLFLRQLLTC